MIRTARRVSWTRTTPVNTSSPLLEEFSVHNRTSGQFVALFGSVDRYLGQFESTLGMGDPVERFRIAGEMGSHMDSAVHLLKEIAERLFISQSTAANHVRSILIKTGAANRTKAAMMAASQGWLTREDG